MCVVVVVVGRGRGGVTCAIGDGPDVGGEHLNGGGVVGLFAQTPLHVLQHQLHHLAIVIVTQVQGPQDVLHLYTHQHQHQHQHQHGQSWSLRSTYPQQQAQPSTSRTKRARAQGRGYHGQCYGSSKECVCGGGGGGVGGGRGVLSTQQQQ